MLVKINAKERKPEVISKKAMRHICNSYEHRLDNLRQEEEHRLHDVEMHCQAVINKWRNEYRKQVLRTYGFALGAGSVGGIIGWLLS